MRKILTVFGALSLSVMALTSCDGNVDLKTPSENLETESKLEGEFTVDQTTIKFSKLGEGQLINAYVGDTLVKDVEYTSSKPEIAEVHNGYVVAKSAGKSVITATYEDKSVEVVVTVESEFKTEIQGAEILSIKSTDAAFTLKADVTTPNVFCSDFGVKWSSSDETVVKVDEKTGEVTPVGQGIAEISAISVIRTANCTL